MNNRLKKPVALFLAMVMITTSVPLFAMAENVGSAPSFADVIESADEQTVPPNSSSDDTELTPFSLLPIEEKSAEIDLSGYTVKQLESMTVGELFGNLKDSDGEAIDVSDATKTVWKNFYDEDGNMVEDTWKVLKMTDTIDIFTYYMLDSYEIEVIIGSGNQTDNTNVRCFLDLNLPKKSADMDLTSYIYPELTYISVSELVKNLTVNGEALTITDPETVEILWDVKNLKGYGIESEQDWKVLKDDDFVKFAPESEDLYEHGEWTLEKKWENQTMIVSVDGVTTLYKIDVEYPYFDYSDLFDFNLYTQKGSVRAKVDVENVYDYTSKDFVSNDDFKYYRRMYGWVNSSYSQSDEYYLGFNLKEELNDKYEIIVLNGWDYDIETLRTKILKKENIGNSDITKKIVVDDMTVTNAGIKAKWLGYCDEGKITVCIKGENSLSVETLRIIFYRNNNSVSVEGKIWTDADDERKNITEFFDSDLVYEKVNGKYRYWDQYSFYLEDGYAANDKYSVSMRFIDGDTDEYTYDTSKIDKAVVGYFDSLDKAKSAKDIKDKLFTEDMTVSGAGYKDNFSGNGVDFTIFCGNDIEHIRIVVKEKHVDSVSVKNSIWKDTEDGRTDVKYVVNSFTEFETVSGKDYKTSVKRFYLEDGYSADDEYSVGMSFTNDLGYTSYDTRIIDKAVVGRFYSLDKAKSAKDIKDQLFAKDMTVSGAGYKDNFSGDGVDFTIFSGDDIWHIRIIVEENGVKSVLPVNRLWKDTENVRSEISNNVTRTSNVETVNGKSYRTDIRCFCLEKEYSVNDEYYIGMYFLDSGYEESNDTSKIDKAVVGHFYSLDEAKSAEDIKDKLFAEDMTVAGAGYKDNFGGDGVDFTIFAGDDLWHIRIVAEEAKEPEPEPEPELDPTPPTVGSSDRYFRVEDLYSENDILDTYVIPYEQDTYYSNGYQTLLINDDAVDMTKVSPYAYLGYHAKVFYNGVEEKTEGSNSKLSARDFTVVPEDTTRNPQNSVKYTVSAENHINQKNYWITAVKKEAGAKLFVNGPDEREVFLNNYYNGAHDIFVANVGSEELTGIKVKLDATNVKLDDYWTLGGEGNNTLDPFTTTENDTENTHGELFNVAKIRLIPDGEGEIDGTLTISADGQKSKVIHLTGVAGNPKIDTTSISEAVKYVPYSAIITTNNMHDWNSVTFELAEGELPEGVELYSSGEIYGVPKETGKFPITIKACYSEEAFEASYAKFTLVVKDNTDENVDASVDKGYEITTRVPKNIKEYKDTKFEIEGVLAEFIDFWLDGEKLVRDIDYTAEEGSTNITIKSQTFKNAGTGKHTISAEFRVDGDANKELKKASQNYTKGGSSSGGAGGATGGKVDENKGNVKDQGITGRVDVDNNTYKVRFESNGGNAVDPLNVNKDTVLTSVPTPERAGFKFGGWYTDKELTKPFDISTKITAAIQLYAKWIEDKPVTDASEFVDVSKNEWFYNDVKWAHENKLMIGISNVEFAPNEAITGGMVVTVLARIANVDVSKYENEKYDDVYEGQWYTPYAKWAKAAGLVDGIPFNPPAEISREAMGVILSRFIDAMGAKYEITEEFIKFADADLISDTAMEAMQTLFKLEIFKGRGNNVIDPASNTTRAEFAALTHRVTGILNK